MQLGSRAPISKALGRLALFFCLLMHLACSEDGTSAPPSPVEQKGSFRFGPFNGLDSLRHYEYSFSEFTLNRIGLPAPDTAKVTTRILGFTVDVVGHENDTARFKIGTRNLIATLDSASGLRDTAYDTTYAYVTYLREGNAFKVLSGAAPFPILDLAFVTDKDTLPLPPNNQISIRILNLEDAGKGSPPEYSHVFSSGYSGGGSGNGDIGRYRAGVGLIHYYAGSAWHNVTIELVRADE